MFSTPAAPASGPAAEPASAPAPYPLQSPDDEEVVEDYSWMEKRKPKPKPKPKQRPRRPSDEATEAQPPCRNCSTQRQPSTPRIRVAARIYSTRDNMRAPIWAPFARNFAICAPGCQPARIGIHRPEDGRRSCHHSDRAIDVGAMICDGRVYTAYSGRFASMVSCMRPRITTLYRQYYKRERVGDTQAHFDHAHFSIGCYGGTFW